MQLQCDVHTHTLYSRHAYATILENVHAAKEAGLTLLGSTDHFSSMLYPDYENIRHYQYLCVSHTWPKEIDGVRLLQGCEVDIVDLAGKLFGYDIPIAKNSFIISIFYSPFFVINLPFSWHLGSFPLTLLRLVPQGNESPQAFYLPCQTYRLPWQSGHRWKRRWGPKALRIA